MNFLEICRRVASKAGIAGSTPATTVNQTGESLRVVNWVQDAYLDIQKRRDDWHFMRKSFSLTTNVGFPTYIKSTIPDLEKWRKSSNKYDPRCYLNSRNDEQFLIFVEWDDFNNTRLFGSQSQETGRPRDYSFSPDHSLVLWPIPDDNYTITGEYYRKAVSFKDNNEEPIFDCFQMLIVYQALMYYAVYSSEPAVYLDSQKEFERLIDKLEINETDTITLGGALA